jgi:hypothetical protein
MYLLSDDIGMLKLQLIELMKEACTYYYVKGAFVVNVKDIIFYINAIIDFQNKKKEIYKEVREMERGLPDEYFGESS